MTDLLSTLPDFPIAPYTHLIPSLEKNGITVSDILTLDALEIVKRVPLPLLDFRKLASHIIEALQGDLGIANINVSTSDDLFAEDSQEVPPGPATAIKSLLRRWKQISTLDNELDNALGGGIPTGYVTEVTGESGAGKTQFLLSLLLAVQLPAPHGLSRSAIYISTEAQLSTIRLRQMLTMHPRFSGLSTATRPSLDNVRAIPVQDLEVQEHILEYQLPTAIRRYNTGLVVLDSVAANFRAEHGSSVPKDLANRAVQLAKLGRLLRQLAVSENVAVVVANQVSDRFESITGRGTLEQRRSSSPATSSSPAQPPPSFETSEDSARASAMTLDHQQRFFTGWGDEAQFNQENLKTPALGLSWANQIGARIALKMEGAKAESLLTARSSDQLGGNIWQDRKKIRFIKLVFAPWARGGEEPIEYEITSQGISAVIANSAEEAPAAGT